MKPSVSCVSFGTKHMQGKQLHSISTDKDIGML